MSVSETLLSRACRAQPVERVPVWLMRQAGRYMPEYQALRQQVDFLELCKTPEMAARATLDAARILETDAAIIFSDITLPAEAMGLELTFSPGPKLAKGVRQMDDVEALREVEPERDLAYVLEAIRLVRAQLDDEISLIGFVGAPLTLAGYMIEAVPNTQWIELKRLVYNQPDVAHALLEKVSAVVAKHAEAQVHAGCDVIQLFDTTAGELAAAELESMAFAYARRVVERLKPLNVPVIYFARRIGAHLEKAATVGADTLALDWTVSIREARARIDDHIALMGNLDPAILLTSPNEIERRVLDILEDANGRDGFVFNLGHGVLPSTPPEHAKKLVDTVRRFAARRRQ